MGRNENVCRALRTIVLWFCHVCCNSGAGMMVGFVLGTFTWWQMVIGTLIGTIMVTIHLLYPSKEFKE